MIKDVTTDDEVLTHSGEYKSIVVNQSVEKEEWIISTSIGEISVSENHKHPVFNTETNSVEIIETHALNPMIHKLLRKKELI